MEFRKRRETPPADGPLPLGELLRQVKRQAPLVHCITNYVTARDCANLLLACGASPVMADDVEEVAEITAVSSGLYLNLGTLHCSSASAMLAAGTRAGEVGIPVLLDPVGVGASRFRRETAGKLLDAVPVAVIRGNASEIKTLVLGSAGARGVDADITDQVTQENLEATAALAQTLAGKTGAVVALTGAVDVVTDGDKAVFIRNGHPMMCRVTGMGCQLSALTAAFVAANPNKPLEGAVAAVCAMGLCGEMAFARLYTRSITWFSEEKPQAMPRLMLMTSTPSFTASSRAGRIHTSPVPLSVSENTLKMASCASGAIPVRALQLAATVPATWVP